MKDEYLYINYDIENDERHNKFEVIFNKIKVEKDKFYSSNIEPSSEVEDWIGYLDEKAKIWFNKIELKPNSEQKKTYDILWEMTAPEIRFKHPIFNTADNWGLDSMLYVIFQGDYQLIKVTKVKNKGALFFDPGGFPFGGTESLVQLIESFGNIVTYDDWHEGPHLRLNIGWNYELAKKHIEQGIELKLPIKENSKEKKWWEFWK